MESLIDTFHVDGRLLLAQAVNFGVAFLVLYFFALKPLLKTMHERSQKIEKSIKDGKEIEERLSSVKRECQEELACARVEANKIIEKADKVGEEKRQEMMGKVKAEVHAFVTEEKARIKTEREEVATEVKKELAGLVAMSLEKILEEKAGDSNFVKKLQK